jgi:hypothetical protein
MNVIVFDIETTGLKPEEGAIFTCASTYHFPSGEHRVYAQSALGMLIDVLKGADVVAGFNINGFDLPFLEKVSGRSLDGVKVYDIYDTVKANGLPMRGANTLNAIWGINCPGMQGKLADGLAAIKYWEEGNVRDLHNYVMQDAKVEAHLAWLLSNYGLVMPNGNKVKRPISEVTTYKGTIPTATISKDVVKQVKQSTPAQAAGVMAAAVKSGFPVRFQYTDNEGETTERVVEQLKWGKNGELQVVGHCRMRSAERCFNLGQISNPCLTK